MSRLNACQPHGVSVFRGDVLTDTASHRVGLVGLSVPIAVSPLIVSGLAGGRYGPSSVATLARPAGIVSVGVQFVFAMQLRTVSSSNRGRVGCVDSVVIEGK